MPLLDRYTADELNAELRAIGIEFDSTTSEWTKNMMILNLWDTHRQNLGDIQQPADPKRRRHDVGGIPGKLIQRLTIESAIPVDLIQRMATLTIPPINDRLRSVGAPFPANGRKAERIEFLIGTVLSEHQRG